MAYSPIMLPVMRLFGLIGFDAADVVRRTLGQFTHQVICLSLNLSTSSRRSTTFVSLNVFWKQTLDEVAIIYSMRQLIYQ